LAAAGERGTADLHVNRASAKPEVVFRIVHVAPADRSPGTDGSPPPSYREQAVEIALGPNATFQNGRVAALTHRVRPSQVVKVVPASSRKARPPRSPKPVGPPRIAETLRKAIEWRRQLDAGKVPNQAAIAHREGITRARVTQIMMLLRLAPEIQERLLALPPTAERSAVSEHLLRPLARLADAHRQLEAFTELAAT